MPSYYIADCGFQGLLGKKKAPAPKIDTERTVSRGTELKEYASSSNTRVDICAAPKAAALPSHGDQGDIEQGFANFRGGRKEAVHDNHFM